MPDLCSSIRPLIVLSCALVAAGCGGGGGGGGSPESTPVVNSGVTPPTIVSPSTPSADNIAPALAGDPIREVSVGEAYSFTPSVTDANGDALTFSASNVPGWASFDPGTGTLSGTPSAADIASYPNILISASDGRERTTLASFTITVVHSGDGSATVSWFPPTQNTDGTALTNLAGYLIHYGRAAENLTGKVKITNPSVSRYLLGNLTAGQWHFAVSAVNSRGVESSLSEIASKTIF